MFELHVEIADDGRAAFRAEASDGGDLKPLRAAALAAAVREVVWYADGFEETEDDSLLRPTPPNLLMFLSDVRVRRFKRGVFLGEDTLRAAELFRSAARIIAAGCYLPSIKEEDGAFAARWRAVADVSDCTPRERAFVEWCVDELARRAHRTVLEADDSAHDTVHDAWLAALRSDSGRLRWSDRESALALARDLEAWRAPLVVSAADRAALRFALVPPHNADSLWLLTLAAPPTTRLGLVSLGQAAALFPPLGGMRGGAARLTLAEAEAFLRTGAQVLSAAGFAVDMPDGVTGEHLTAEADLSPAASPKGGGEAEDDSPAASQKVAAKLTIRVDGEKVTERELQFLLDQGSSLVFFRDRWIEVDRNVLREAMRAIKATKSKKLSMREAASFAFGVGRAGRLRVAKVSAHGWLRGLLNELRGEQQFKILPPPDGLKGTLRDYQQRGYSWLAFLARWGFGPCLADDMGLGKTIQAIAFILSLKTRPVLVVAPVSVTTNWTREFRRFAPGLKVLLHQGGERSIGGTLRRACKAADVVVTGYSLFVRDFADLASVGFSALVLDEAQTVKNPDTRAAKAARALDVSVKVALTGTPFENSANDLWSLEEILNPGLLGERRSFEEDFTKSIRTDAQGGAAARLRHVLEPFMLRRLKTDPGVAAELGDKREVREYCPLSLEQRRQYETALASYRTDVAGGESSRGRMLALLTELKLICDGEGKLARLDELLAEMFENGESCLVFTQYAKVGRMIRAHLQETFGRLFPFLHGSLSPAQREAEIAAFNASAEPNAFILSLKAGGFGLNLTRATHVVHFDRWWNPAVENQATDRAHRIGQTKTVFVHTFICAGTLEDHVDELLETKRFIAGEVISGGESFLLKMSQREFDRIVSIE